MLPGFRFLFAATVLSVSMLIFGLGAAALLRAAHEEFASIPSRRALPEVMFTQQSDDRPALAMLRLEPSADEKTINPPTTDNVQDQPAIVSTPAEMEKPAAEPDKTAALSDIASPAESSSPSGVSKPEAAASEIAGQAETPAQADAASAALETKVAAIAEMMTPPAPNRATATAPDQATVPIDDSTRIAETRIATLGGPPVTIETQPPSKTASAVVKKSTQAKRVVTRRRITQRARVVRPAPQQPANPFGTRFGS
jgi:hypothetical protein